MRSEVVMRIIMILSSCHQPQFSSNNQALLVFNTTVAPLSKYHQQNDICNSNTEYCRVNISKQVTCPAKTKTFNIDENASKPLLGENLFFPKFKYSSFGSFWQSLLFTSNYTLQSEEKEKNIFFYSTVSC